MTDTRMTPMLTIPLEDCILGGANIEILRAEIRADISSALALIRYSEHGDEPQYGIRLDLDKKVFIDHLTDIEQEGFMQRIAPELADILNPVRQEVRLRQLGYIRQGSAPFISAAGEQFIEVAEAGLASDKQQVQRGGVQVYSRTTEKPIEASVNLREEHVTVERHEVNRPSSRTDFLDVREGKTKVTKVGGGPVAAKEARTVEEVVVGKAAIERTETIQDTVRRTDVQVEQTSGVKTHGVSGADTKD